MVGRLPIAANLPVVVASILLSSCGSPLPPADAQTTSPTKQSAPGDDRLRQRLIATGLPARLVDYFSAGRVEVVGSDSRSLAYRETYPDGATADIAYAFVPRQTKLSDEEVSAARELGVRVYRPSFSETTVANGPTTTILQFFVPYDEMSPEVRDALRPATARAWWGLLGIAEAVAQGADTGGIDVIVSATVLETVKQSINQVAEIAGKGQGAAAGLAGAIEINGALALKTETEEYYRRLDELERCAKNPTHNVPVSDEERQRQLDTLASIRSELKQVTAARFLGSVADAPLNFIEAGGLVGAGLSIALKPVSAWSDQALKSYIENTLMREANAAVVPCRKPCDDSAPTPAGVASPNAPPPLSPASAASSGPSSKPATGPTASTSSPPVQASTRPADPGTPSPAPEGVCKPESKRVVLRFFEVERYHDLSGVYSLDRFASYLGTATNVMPFGSALSQRLEGSGAGTYREHARHLAYDWCEHDISTNVPATMNVTVRLDRRDVVVGFHNDRIVPVDYLWERDLSSPQCGFNGNAYTGAHREPGPLDGGCRFSNVDFDKGGVYRSDEEQDYADEDERRLVTCELIVGGPPMDDRDLPPPPPPPPRPSPHAASPLSTVPPSIPPVPPASLAGAGVPGGAVANAPPAATQEPSDSRRYRATVAGALVLSATRDTDTDGKGDEVYAAAVTIVWDRTRNVVLDTRVAQAREYGDAGVPQRVRAGTAGPGGGLRAGDVVPTGFDPDAGPGLAATDRLPLVVWEGGLSDNQVVVVIPTLWERDTRTTLFDAYRTGWKTLAAAELLSEAAIATALEEPLLTAVAAGSSSFAQPPPRSVPGRYFVVNRAVLAANANEGEDRPIGISTLTASSAVYPERYVVLTREKLKPLIVGTATTIDVPLIDVDEAVLGGVYELYLRVERVQ